jgi:RND family efflux transporter MFP subunit
MKRIWIVLGIILGVIVIGGVGYLGFSTSKPKVPAAPQAPQAVSVTRCNVEQSVTAPGSVVNFQETNIEMPVDGKLAEILAQPGDTVKKGQVLARLDSTSQELALATAKQKLAELTSPEAIANAKLAVTTAQADVTNAQIALNNQQYWKNDALIKDYYANLVIAKANLDQMQQAYDDAKVGEYINNADEAQLYKALYSAQQAYNLAEFYFSVYSQKPPQRQLDAAQATLDLAKVKLTNAQNNLAALTGGDVPADATSSLQEALKQAKLAVQTAQDNLDATQITAPFDGIILESNAETQKFTPAGTSLFTMHDPQDIEIKTTVTEVDFPYVKVGQNVTLYFDALLDVQASGVVSRIIPLRASGDTPLYYVYIRLDKVPDHLVDGMTADGVISIAQRQQVLCLPRAVVHASSGNTATVKVWNGVTTEERQIEIGLRGDIYLEILSGLKEGEKVVTQ